MIFLFASFCSEQSRQFLFKDGSCHFETTKLTFRTIVWDDFDTFARMNNDPKIKEFMAGGPKCREASFEHFNLLIKSAELGSPTAWISVINNVTKSPIGFFCLESGGIHSSETQIPEGFGEIVCMIDNEFQGKKIGSNILFFIMNVYAPTLKEFGLKNIPGFSCYGGKPLSNIWATVHPENRPSLYGLYKFGMMPWHVEGSRKITDKFGEITIECALKEVYQSKRYYVECPVTTFPPLSKRFLYTNTKTFPIFKL